MPLGIAGWIQLYRVGRRLCAAQARRVNVGWMWEHNRRKLSLSAVELHAAPALPATPSWTNRWVPANRLQISVMLLMSRYSDGQDPHHRPSNFTIHLTNHRFILSRPAAPTIRPQIPRHILPFLRRLFHPIILHWAGADLSTAPHSRLRRRTRPRYT